MKGLSQKGLGRRDRRQTLSMEVEELDEANGEHTSLEIQPFLRSSAHKASLSVSSPTIEKGTPTASTGH